MINIYLFEIYKSSGKMKILIKFIVLILIFLGLVVVLFGGSGFLIRWIEKFIEKICNYID